MLLENARTWTHGIEVCSSTKMSNLLRLYTLDFYIFTVVKPWLLAPLRKFLSPPHTPMPVSSHCLLQLVLATTALLSV